MPDLLRLLRTTLDGGLAAEAAESLSLLGIVESVPHIESALDAFTDSEHVHKFAAALARFGTPSSLALVLSAMERTRYPSERCLMIDVLGAWLPMEPARRTLTEALTLRSSHSIFRGEQRAAIHAFVDHDPAFLIRQVARLYRKGNLEDQSAGALAYHIVSLARGARAASDDLLDLLQLLSTDRRLEVREKAADALSMVDPLITRQVLARLHGEGGVWEQACAVTVLGYCDGDIEEIRAAQRAPAFLVRHAADTAIDVRQRRQQCGVLVSQFATLEGVARLSAYLCLCEHGDPQALRRYNAALDAREDMRYFKRQISSMIWDLYTKDQEKRAKVQLDLFENLGTIHFD